MGRTKTMDSFLKSKRKREKRDYNSYQYNYVESVGQMHQQYLPVQPPAPLMLRQTNSVGAELSHLEVERAILTEPEDNHKRRSLLLHKNNQSWGFTLQTYGIKNKKTNEVEVMTYVDYVDLNSSAYIAGLRTGDVILSVNGCSMEYATHKDLVAAIKHSGDQLRLVVLFENCVHKVELYDRIIRLKRVVTSKMKELQDLEFQEREILERYCESRGISRYDNIRQSVYSTASSSSWDRYSVLSSQNISNFPKPKHSLPKILISGDRFSDSVLVRSEDDTGSQISESLGLVDSYCNISYADSDSDSVSGLRFTCDGHSINSGSLSSVRSHQNDPKGTINPADGNIGALYEDQIQDDFDDFSMDKFGAHGPIDITFNPLLRHDIRKIKSEGHMETLEWKSSRKSEQNLKQIHKLQVPNLTSSVRESKQRLEEQRCGSFRSLQEHGLQDDERSEVNSSRSEVRHKQLSLNSLEKISTSETDQSTPGTTDSIKPQKRPMSGDDFQSENSDDSIKIPFLHSGPVHINERSEVTKL